MLRRETRTKIEDISNVGEELHEEHLRLANGGLRIYTLRVRTVGTNDPINQVCRLDRVIFVD
jgi:hypothetical protein